MSRPLLRLYGAALALSAWLALLLLGHVAGGAVHLLLLASLALFPWGSSSPTDRGR